MHRDLRRLETEVTSAIKGLSLRETQLAPLAQPEKWSIQQIIEHLLETYRASIPAIQHRLEKRTPTRARPTLGQRMGQFTLITLGRFPPGRRAPDMVSPGLPTALRSGDELADRVRAELMLFDAVAALGEGIFGRQRAVQHMVLGPLSMQQWRRFHLIHGMHHMRQIRRILQDHALGRSVAYGRA